MIYIDVTWYHDDPACPVRLVSELDENRWELRKLEFYRDGRVGKVTGEGSTLDAALSIEPLPSIEEINGDRQFSASPMESDAFHALWLEQSRGKDKIV